MSKTSTTQPTTSSLKAKFDSGKFVVTCELSPPKGTNLLPLIEKAEMLKGMVDAFNLTDSAAARMTMDPTVVGYQLLQRGIEPIVQITSRDKNRLALQSGMLGADALGVSNLVIMGGDPPKIGDHPEAKGVSDLFSSQIIAAAHALNQGTDYAGNTIDGATNFYIGSVCNPGATDLSAEIDNTHRKIAAGAQFLQTQAIYQTAQFTTFMEQLQQPDIAVLAGIIPIKSVKMATYMNERVPGINIPNALIERIAAAEQSGTVVDESLAIATETIHSLRQSCNGIHIMAIGWEKHVQKLLERLE